MLCKGTTALEMTTMTLETTLMTMEPTVMEVAEDMAGQLAGEDVVGDEEPVPEGVEVQRLTEVAVEEDHKVEAVASRPHGSAGMKVTTMMAQTMVDQVRPLHCWIFGK